MGGMLPGVMPPTSYRQTTLFQGSTHMNHCLHCCLTCCYGFAAQNDGKEIVSYSRNWPEMTMHELRQKMKGMQ